MNKNENVKNKLRVHVEQSNAISQISEYLKSLEIDKPIKFVCIGTDRSTGDCLAPFIGTQLQKLGYDVVGTLEEPLHAVNLKETLKKNNYYKDFFVIAIDACLGRSESVGYINIKEEPLQPGTGVNKNDLPEIGDLQIIGVVNIGGFMEYSVLQNTRLSLISKMSDVIVNGIKRTFSLDENEIQEKNNIITNCTEFEENELTKFLNYLSWRQKDYDTNSYLQW